MACIEVIPGSIAWLLGSGVSLLLLLLGASARELQNWVVGIGLSDRLVFNRYQLSMDDIN